MDRADKRFRAQMGAAIRRARLEQGLTQHEVAEELGLAVEVYGRYERGQTAPSVYTLRPLTALLRTSADVLLGLDRRAEPTPKPSAEAQRLQRAVASIAGPELKLIRSAVELMAEGSEQRRVRQRRRRAT